mmetsp:Transcript_17785/g.18003  ORF Transcript_17785/g.18003 Transcript_17785/m.18003 type:complete len:98 (-) Transcript_17785:80-373(-)
MLFVSTSPVRKTADAIMFKNSPHNMGLGESCGRKGDGRLAGDRRRTGVIARNIHPVDHAGQIRVLQKQSRHEKGLEVGGSAFVQLTHPIPIAICKPV